MLSRFSSIDIGSNAIRMIVGETQNSNLRVLKKLRAPIRLGRDVFLSTEISKQNIDETVDAFKTFAKTNREYNVVRCRAVATSAVREAKNRDLLIKKVFAETKIPIEVIDGVEEARLVHNAIRREIDLEKKCILSIDIGGGSVEITFSENGMMSATESFPMGTVRILDQMTKRKLSENQLNVILGEFVVPLTNYLDSHVHSAPLHFAVGTGGNLECMAQLKTKMLKKTPATYLSLRELREIADRLSVMTYKERIEKLGLRADRSDVILPATLLVQTILRQARIEKIFIPNVGLRDGLLWSTAGLS
ncbi:MAG: hypothetical protein IPM97_12125 [Bdellovibrionaceae bacterium]|nr:hypothetical protein [Pseudobdellovibrionaceae bacterium]